MSWPLVKLGDICKTTQGVQITKSNTADQPYEGGYRYLYIADFLRDKKLSFVDDLYDVKKVTVDDLVMANTGSPGRVFKGKDGILSNNLFKITFDLNVVDRDYLYLALSSNAFQSVLQQQMKGGIQKHLGHQTISRQSIPLPPLEEQKRIAAILDKAGAVRRKRQQAIDLTDQLLRSVFLDMFGDPLTNPKGWGKIPLGDCTYLDAQMVDPKKLEFQNLKHVGAERIQKNTGKILPCLTAAEDKLISNKFLFDDKYILYTKIRPYLKKVSLPDFKGLCSADIYPVRPDRECLTKEYLWFTLISDAFVSYTETLPSRASIPKLNRKEFARFEIMIPPIKLQEKYSKIFKIIIEQKKIKYAALLAENDLFNSLTQQAFKGELIKQSKAA